MLLTKAASLRLPRSVCLLCRDANELRAHTGWDGAGGSSRRHLLSLLQAHVPPALLLPEHRLETLMQQAVLWQTRGGSSAIQLSGDGVLFVDAGRRPCIVPQE